MSVWAAFFPFIRQMIKNQKKNPPWLAVQLVFLKLIVQQWCEMEMKMVLVEAYSDNTFDRQVPMIFIFISLLISKTTRNRNKTKHFTIRHTHTHMWILLTHTSVHSICCNLAQHLANRVGFNRKWSIIKCQKRMRNETFEQIKGTTESFSTKKNWYNLNNLKMRIVSQITNKQCFSMGFFFSKLIKINVIRSNVFVL